MKHFYRLLVLVMILGQAAAASANVSAWLSRNRIGPGESVQLTLQHDGQTDSQPDLGPLMQNFDILGRSSGSTIQFINGHMSSKFQIDLTLSPKHSGQLLVPPLQWDGQSTPALTLTVGGNSAQPQGNGAAAANGAAPANNANVFIQATPNPKHPYVQSAVTLTVRLYTDRPLYQASLELQPSNNVLVQQVGKDTQSSRIRNGRTYRVVERKYLLFPQRSGTVRLDGPVLNAQVPVSINNGLFGADPFFHNFFSHNPFGGMMNTTRPIRVRGDQIVLDVRPRPASGTGHGWLPAQKVTLTQSWQPANGPIHAGDPITRHLHLSALGLTGSQLPDLSLIMPLPKGIRAYPDQAKLSTHVRGGGVIGTRNQDIALIADRSGRYRIPPLHLYWWDTINNLQREIDLPAHTITVLPNGTPFAAGTSPSSGGSSANSAGAAVPPTEQTAPAPKAEKAGTNIPWPWISLALALLWLATLLVWWLSKRRSPKPMPGKAAPATTAPIAGKAEARRAFRRACRENDPLAARRYLLDWARATWPQDPPIGLGALAKRLADPELKPLLDQLDRACYSEGEWHGAAMLEKSAALTKKSSKANRRAPELAGLYP